MTSFCAWDTASGANLGLVGLQLSTLVMTFIAERSNGIKITLCQLPLLLILVIEFFFCICCL